MACPCRAKARISGVCRDPGKKHTRFKPAATSASTKTLAYRVFEFGIFSFFTTEAPRHRVLVSYNETLDTLFQYSHIEVD